MRDSGAEAGADMLYARPIRQRQLTCGARDMLETATV